MNWSMITRLATPSERASSFLSMQRKRYGREPVQAALALWKGVCSEPMALQVLGDVREVVRLGLVSGVDLAYLRSLLGHYELLASYRLRMQQRVH